MYYSERINAMKTPLLVEASCGDEQDEHEDVDTDAGGGDGEIGGARRAIGASGSAWERLLASGSASGSLGSAWALLDDEGLGLPRGSKIGVGEGCPKRIDSLWNCNLLLMF